MAPRKKKVSAEERLSTALESTKRETEMMTELAKAMQTIEQLRGMVETQTIAAATHQSRLATAVPTHRSPGGELLVGIRNVSDLTIGIPALFKGDPSLHLHADFGDHDPNSVAIISYSWWREIRRGDYVGWGLIIRDDSVLGEGHSPAPEDRPQEMHPGHFLNVVEDPKEWIDSREPEQITQDLNKITSNDTLMRIRRVVDEDLRRLEAQYPRETISQQVAAAKKSLKQLSAKYRHVDELVTMRLDRTDDEAEPLRTTL